MKTRATLSVRLLVLCLLAVAASIPAAPPARAQAYVGKPRLIVLVVIDQFRGDYLNRFHDRFQGRGFRLFTDQGAWFTDCYYDYANTKTAPGHATIGTGAYTDGHGIESNEWWDASRSDEVKVSSVEDERYQLVDIPPSSIPANQPGAAPWAPRFGIGSSPLNLRATTLGDELRLATHGRARVYGVSLKDRAAILPVGQSANGAFWIDPPSGQFTTSTYYMEHLPGWARAFNTGGRIEQAEREANVDPAAAQFYDLVGRTPAANRYELDFAKALITGERLGQSGVTDLVSISLSANDILGHQMGPDSDAEEEMILSLDRDLDGFFTWLDQTMGLRNVWVALSADHGIPPIPREGAKLGIDAAMVEMDKVYAELNRELNRRFSPGERVDYLMPGPELPYIVLNRHAFEKVHVDERTAEEAVGALLPAAVALQSPAPPPVIGANSPAPAAPSLHRLPPAPQVVGTYTRLQLAGGGVPPTAWGGLLAHSYAWHGNWFVMLVLGGYQMENTAGGTTHFSPWGYDRHVPLAFYGTPFIPGEYHERVAPVDLAATFASLAGVNQPSASIGRVLTEAMRPARTAGQ